jgi:hypothetical protein
MFYGLELDNLLSLCKKYLMLSNIIISIFLILNFCRYPITSS